jgi:hypothetical protein
MSKTEIIQAVIYFISWCASTAIYTLSIKKWEKHCNNWAGQHSHWISVNEKLPENDGGFSDMVLVYTKDKCYYTAQFNYISNCWFAECSDDEITHWMNLPKPPTQ